jgi:hypothetical protein
VPASIGLGTKVKPVLTHVTVSFPRFHLHSHDRGQPWPEVVAAVSSSTSTEDEAAAIDEAVEAVEAVDPIGRSRRAQQRRKRGLLMSLILTFHLR